MEEKNRTLEQATEDVVTRLVEAQDAEEIKQLTQLFNINQMKKDALRVMKLNDILEQLDGQVSRRVEEHPDQFSNTDLLNYVNTIQQTIVKSTQGINNLTQTPLIQLNQQNNIVNISEDTLSRESRERILDAVQQFLNYTQGTDTVQIEDADVVYYNNEEDSE